jgi:hypothetical protein
MAPDLVAAHGEVLNVSSTTVKKMTADDVEKVVTAIRVRLLRAVAANVDVSIKLSAGFRDTTGPLDTFVTHSPDGRSSIEIHIGGGVDEDDFTKPRRLTT